MRFQINTGSRTSYIFIHTSKNTKQNKHKGNTKKETASVSLKKILMNFQIHSEASSY